MRYAAILSALVAHLRTFPGWDDTACAWPNRPFEPGSEGFWKADLIPSGVDSALGADGADHERGIFQVTRYEPASVGATPALVSVDAMAAHFSRRVLTGTGVSVACGVPDLGPPIQEPSWVSLPLSISFTAL